MPRAYVDQMANMRKNRPPDQQSNLLPPQTTTGMSPFASQPYQGPSFAQPQGTTTPQNFGPNLGQRAGQRQMDYMKRMMATNAPVFRMTDPQFQANISGGQIPSYLQKKRDLLQGQPGGIPQLGQSGASTFGPGFTGVDPMAPSGAGQFVNGQWVPAGGTPGASPAVPQPPASQQAPPGGTAGAAQPNPADFGVPANWHIIDPVPGSALAQRMQQFHQAMSAWSAANVGQFVNGQWTPVDSPQPLQQQQPQPPQPTWQPPVAPQTIQPGEASYIPGPGGENIARAAPGGAPMAPPTAPISRQAPAPPPPPPQAPPVAGPPPAAAPGAPSGQPSTPGVPPAAGVPGTPSTAPPPGPTRQISTSIEPQPIYPPDFAQSQGNLAAALATPSRTDIMAGRGNRGLSLNSPAIQQGAAIDWGNQMAKAQMVRPQVTQQIEFANLQNILAGEQAREQEALGWGQLAGGQEDYQNRIRQIQQNSLLGMLMGQGAWWT